MTTKSNMLVVSLSTWMYAATSCAVLPFLHALPQLKSIGSMAPLVAALVVGALAGIPLSILVRRLSGVNSPRSEANA